MLGCLAFFSFASSQNLDIQSTKSKLKQSSLNQSNVNDVKKVTRTMEIIVAGKYKGSSGGYGGQNLVIRCGGQVNQQCYKIYNAGGKSTIELPTGELYRKEIGTIVSTSGPTETHPVTQEEVNTFTHNGSDYTVSYDDGLTYETIEPFNIWITE